MSSFLVVIYQKNGDVLIGFCLPGRGRTDINDPALLVRNPLSVRDTSNNVRTIIMMMMSAVFICLLRVGHSCSGDYGLDKYVLYDQHLDFFSMNFL